MKFLPAFLIIFAFLPVARAVVNVEGTRVIIHQGERSASLTLSNSEKQPTMVQSGVIIAIPSRRLKKRPRRLLLFVRYLV